MQMQDSQSLNTPPNNLNQFRFTMDGPPDRHSEITKPSTNYDPHDPPRTHSPLTNSNSSSQSHPSHSSHPFPISREARTGSGQLDNRQQQEQDHDVGYQSANERNYSQRHDAIESSNTAQIHGVGEAQPNEYFGYAHHAERGIVELENPTNPSNECFQGGYNKQPQLSEIHTFPPHSSAEINYEENNQPLISQQMEFEPVHSHLQDNQDQFYNEMLISQTDPIQYEHQPVHPEEKEYTAEDPFQSQNLNIDNDPLLSQPDTTIYSEPTGQEEGDRYSSPQRTLPRPSDIHTIPEVTEPECSFLKSNRFSEQPFMLGDQLINEEIEATETNLLEYAHNAQMQLQPRQQVNSISAGEEDIKENAPIHAKQEQQVLHSPSDSSKQHRQTIQYYPNQIDPIYVQESHPHLIDSIQVQQATFSHQRDQNYAEESSVPQQVYPVQIEEPPAPSTVNEPMEFEYITPVVHHHRVHTDIENYPQNEQIPESRYEEEISPKKYHNYEEERSPFPQEERSLPLDERSKGSSKDNYVVEISNCKENPSSHVKNNDIYGINQEPHQPQPIEINVLQKNHEEECREEQYHISNPETNTHDNISSYVHDNIDSNTHEITINIPKKNETLQIVFTDAEVKEEEENTNPHKEEYVSERIEQAEEEPSLDKTIDQLISVLDSTDSNLTDDIKFRMSSHILEPHIDLLFLKPTTIVGEQFLTDGKLSLLFIRFMALKQESPDLKRLLQKYLFATISSKITTNREEFDAARKSQTSSVSLEVSFKKERYDADNDSMFVHDGSEARGPFPSRSQQMEMDDPNEQPLKRTVLQRNDYNYQSSVSPRSGRPNKTKRRSNIKGITTSKKVQISDEPPSQSKPKSASKNRGEKEVQQLNSDPISKSAQQLGSKFTFATLTHKGLYKHKEVVQVRVSQRILEKKTVKQGEQETSNNNDSSFELRPSRKKSHKKSTKKNSRTQVSPKNSKEKQKRVSQGQENGSKRRSTKFLNFQDDSQLLSISYLKDHCQEIKLCLDLNENDALTDRDKQLAKYIREFDSLKKQAEQMSEQDQQEVTRELESRRDPPSNAELDTREEQSREGGESREGVEGGEDGEGGEETMSQNRSNTVHRLKELRKNIAQYKIKTLPVEFSRVVDPDINGHGIYALLELTRVCHQVLGYRYALTPITNLDFANKRFIEQDLASARAQAGDECDNLAYVQLSSALQKRVEEERRRRAQ